MWELSRFGLKCTTEILWEGKEEHLQTESREDGAQKSRESPDDGNGGVCGLRPDPQQCQVRSGKLRDRRCLDPGRKGLGGFLKKDTEQASGSSSGP